jgi:hypothetical protein
METQVKNLSEDFISKAAWRFMQSSFEPLNPSTRDSHQQKSPFYEVAANTMEKNPS